MNDMRIKPTNMTRVLLVSDEGRTLETAYYKDGMYSTDNDIEWYNPHCFEGWMDYGEVKIILGIK